MEMIWIPIKKGSMPRENVQVLICANSSMCGRSVYFAHFSYNDKAIPEYGHKAGDNCYIHGAKTYYKATWKKEGITHWMPIPDPTQI